MHLSARYRSLTLMLLSSAASLGCSSETRAWERASEEGSLEALEGYVAEHPDGAHAAEAASRIDEYRAREEESRIEAAWETARGVNTVEAYEAFLAHHAATARDHDARRAITELRWTAARERHEPEGYREFLADHPTDPHAGDAALWIGSNAFTFVEGAGEVGLRGRFMSNQLKLIESMHFTQDVLVDGKPARLSMNISAEGGHMDRDLQAGTIVCPDDVVLAVDGAISFIDGAGAEARVSFTDVYLPRSMDVLAGWIAADDLRFGRTDVERLIASGSGPIRTGHPGTTVDPTLPRTLFAISSTGLRHVR